MLDIFLEMASANLQFHRFSSPFLPEFNPPVQRVIMTQKPQKVPFSLSVILLEAYEDRTPPPGAPEDHPVGHAIVALRIENLTVNNVQLDIKQLEICQSDNNKTLISQAVLPTDNNKNPRSQTVRKFNLGGLQILEQGFNLTNSQGFMRAKKVKAVVTYQFNGKSYVAESPISEVVVNP